MEFYVYAYLDPRKPGKYEYGDVCFLFEPFYIGKGKGRRMYIHLTERLEKTRNTLKYYKINKIIREFGAPYVIKVFEFALEGDAYEKEKLLITRVGKLKDGGVLTNIADGGRAGISGSKIREGKSKKEIEEWNYNAKKGQEEVSDERRVLWYKNISKANKGMKFSDEHREKLSETNWKKVAKDNGESAPLTEEHKRKLSEATKGKPFSDEHRKNLRKTMDYDSWKREIPGVIEKFNIKSITEYRKVIKGHPELNMSQSPHKGYRNDGWEGWGNLRVLFKESS